MNSDKQEAECVIERVYLAVESLCIGKGDLRSRLLTVWSHLEPLNANEFPIKLRNDFKWIIDTFDNYFPRNRYEGYLFEKKFSRMRNTTGQKIAIRVFELYSNLQEIRGYPLL